MTMNIVFTSPAYQVVEYPELGAYELVDARRGTGGFLQGGVADLFRVSMEGLIGNDPSQEEVEDVIGQFDALLTQPWHYH